MPFEEQTATIGDIVEKEPYVDGLPRSSYLQGGWRDGAIINEFRDIGEVITGRGKISYSTRPLGRWRGEVRLQNTRGIHVAWASLISDMREVGNMIFIEARWFMSGK